MQHHPGQCRVRADLSVTVQVKRLPGLRAYLWCVAQLLRLMILPAGIFMWVKLPRSGWRPVWLWNEVGISDCMPPEPPGAA